MHNMQTTANFLVNKTVPITNYVNAFLKRTKNQ